MFDGIRVVKCIISLTLMVGSPVAILIYKNRERTKKSKLRSEAKQSVY